MKSIDVGSLWKDALGRMDAKAWSRLQTERGYSPEFCAWLETQKLIGIHKGGWAFGVYDVTDTLVSIHYRNGDSWRYEPSGLQVHPMVIRGKTKATNCHNFESQWDGFAIIDRLELYRRDDLFVIVTRGAENGGLITQVSIPPVPIFLWSQDDGMTERHRLTPFEDRPSTHWINGVRAALNGATDIRVILPPIGYKDWCDLTAAGATAKSIRAIAQAAKPEPQPEPEIEFPDDEVADEEEIPTQDFPLSDLTQLQKEFAQATADSLGVHPNLPAIASLGIVAAAIGSGLYAKSGPNQTIRGNLFLLASAISGEGKSEAARPLVAPFTTENQNRIDLHQEQLYPAYASEKGLALREIRVIENLLYGRKKDTLSPEQRHQNKERHCQLQTRLKELEDSMVQPAMLTNDCTQEMMPVLMQHNREQLFSFSADAAKAVYNLEGLYNKLSVPEDNFYVCAYSGDPINVHRIGRPPINLANPCLTLLWFIQPDLFNRMLANERLREGGFLPRALICDTQLQPRESDGNEPPIPSKLLADYAELIHSLITTYWDNDIPQEIALSEDQQNLFRSYRNWTVQARLTHLKDINSFVARWPEQARRIAIGQHAARYGNQSHLIPMADDTVEKSIRITRWFADEQLRILQVARQNLRSKDMEFLRDLLLTKYPQGVPLRTLHKSHNKSEEAIAALAKEFPSVFLIDTRKPPGRGRPSPTLTLRTSHH